MFDAEVLAPEAAAPAALDEDERSKFILDRRVGEQLIVNESGLYTLILRNCGAVIEGTVSHRFRRWVTGEVLPAIRQTGAYATNLDDPATLRRLLLGKLDRIDVLEVQVEETTHALAIAHQVIEHNAPKVEVYDMLLSDSGTLCLADAARHVGAKQEAFFAWIRTANLVFEKGGDLHPVAEHRLDGRFVLKLFPLPNGKHRAQTRVTKQGLVWLTHRWKAHQIVVQREAERARIQGELGL